MIVIAEQACPVCRSPIELHAGPWRWVHTFGTCTSPTYQALCDPDPFVDGLAPTEHATQARARIRGKARQQLHRSRARGSYPNSLIQSFRDDISAEHDAHQAR